MPAFASILAPMSYGNAIELGNRQWRKRVLPVGEIQYQGRTLKFTRAYNDGLAAAFRDRAYDQVSFQLAPGDNSHTNDPERHRGTITDLVSEPDGLWMIMSPTERGEQVLRENPYLGVSARIVEQYQRADGRFYPAAVQHVLGTLDPRIPALGSWEPIDMASPPTVVIDLSGSSFTGQQQAAPLTAADLDNLTDDELNDLIDVLAETEDYDDDGELTDDELEMLMQAAEADYEDPDPAEPDPFSEFAATFDNHAAIELARAEAAAEPVARREEDRVAQLFRHAAAGVYGGQVTDFAAESAAVEVTLANGGYGACGPVDDFGRCSAKYHALECGHGQAADFAASGAAVELTGLKGWSHGWIRDSLGLGSATEAAARGAGLPLEQPGLKPHQQRVYHRMRAIGHPHERALAFARRAGAAAGRAFDVGGSTRVFNQSNPSPMTVWGDPEDLDEPWQQVPQATVELAHELAIDWGLDAAPGAPGAEAYLDLLRSPGAPVSTEDAMLEAAGYELPAAGPEPSYPGVAEIRAQMGI